ncbi:DNA primase [Streptobacillus felis]|uniref:DNA primase n=1 Tax=Streptobacillus felis TaxID=1384509 RepID=A0A7Z0PEI5_9FUSO|nr:DNA primase [Streptobacillus felis]NYV27793.1 DNA primase [Streptobacillus felis]
MNKVPENEEKVINGIDIVDLIGQFVDLSKAGQSYKGYSPFKSENTPSFSVHPGKKFFKDFSSGIGGNVIKFYSLIKNISYSDALEELAKKYGIAIKINKSKKGNYDTLGHKILLDAQKYYADNLEKSTEAIEYLKKRGYDLKDLKKYQIGYATKEWHGLYNFLKEKYADEELLKIGIVARSQTDSENIYDVFRERIMFPIFNKFQQIIGFGGRYIGDNKEVPKYLNSTESYIFDKSSELYGIFDRGIVIKNSKYAILMEGFLDVLSSHINNYSNAVASLGTAFTEKQAKLLKNYTNSIVIMYDKDEAGQKATKSVIKILNRLEFNIKCSSLPDDVKDPDEYFKKYKSSDFNGVLTNSIDALEYMVNAELKNFDLTQPASKIEAIKIMRPYFESITNEIIFKDGINKFSKIIGVEYKYIFDMYSKNIHNKYNNEIIRKKEKVIETNTIKQKDLGQETLEHLLLSKEVNVKLYELLLSFLDESKEYAEIHKKLLSVNYQIDRIPDIEFTEEEMMLLGEITFTAKEYGDEDFIRIIKLWMDNRILEYIEYLKMLPSGESIKYMLDAVKLKKELKRIVLIEDLLEFFEQIKVLKGERNGG